jgi:hypothetical protein
VSLLLTVLTYYFIEKKLRHNKGRWVLPLLVGAFLVTGLTAAAVWKGLVPSRYDDAIKDRIAKIQSALHDQNMMAEWGQERAANGFLVNRAGGDGKKTLYLGDSYMQQYAPRILFLLRQYPNRGAIFVASGGMLPIPGIRQGASNEWLKMFSVVEDLLGTDPKIVRVVIAARWCNYFNSGSDWRMAGISLGAAEGRARAIQALGGFIRKCSNAGRQVTLVLATPTGAAMDPKAMCVREFIGIKGVKIPLMKRSDFENLNAELLEAIEQTAKENGSTVVNPLDFLCNSDGVIPTLDKSGVPVGYDDHHLRPGYVREHVKYLDQTIAP